MRGHRHASLRDVIHDDVRQAQRIAGIGRVGLGCVRFAIRRARTARNVVDLHCNLVQRAAGLRRIESENVRHALRIHEVLHRSGEIVAFVDDFSAGVEGPGCEV